MFISSGYSAQTRSVRSATQHHHRRADVLERLRDLPGRLRAQAEGGGLVREVLGVETVELDDVVRGRPRAVARDDLAHALDGGAVAEVAHRDGAARIDHGADLAEVGDGRLVVLGVEGL